MKKILASLALLSIFIIPASIYSKASHPSILDSVRPILDTKGGVICTAFSVYSQKGLWMSAGHCMEDGITLAGSEINLVAFGQDQDLAVFSSTIKAPSIELADHAPDWLDPILAVGYPYGDGPLMSKGYIQSPSQAERDGGGIFMRFSVDGCPGNSGSPIMTENFKLLSVWQDGWGVPGQCGSVMGGVTYPKLREFLLPLLFN